jgi:hypothetical protein
MRENAYMRQTADLTFRRTDGFHITLAADQYRQISSPARIRAALAEENVVGFVETDVVDEPGVHEVNMALELR